MTFWKEPKSGAFKNIYDQNFLWTGKSKSFAEINADHHIGTLCLNFLCMLTNTINTEVYIMGKYSISAWRLPMTLISAQEIKQIFSISDVNAWKESFSLFSPSPSDIFQIFQKKNWTFLKGISKTNPEKYHLFWNIWNVKASFHSVQKCRLKSCMLQY